MDNIICLIIMYGVGIVSGIWISTRYITINYRDPMDALGIEKFQKCEINTINCHSNWYEIVYKEKNK